MQAHDIRFGILALVAEGFENSLPLRNAPLPVTVRERERVRERARTGKTKT